MVGPAPLTHTGTTSTRIENDNDVITKTKMRRWRSTMATTSTASNTATPSNGQNTLGDFTT